MKILFVSMHSLHFLRWVENLKGTNYELYWFDVLNRGEIENLAYVKQLTAWKKRKLPRIKGEYFLTKKFPKIYEKIQPYLEVTANEALKQIILEIQPDVVHSFEMQHCSYPILKTMNNFSDIKWIYSCWGSDLYYYQNIKEHNFKIKNILKRIDYLLTDCMRDNQIARNLGFTNEFLGVIPGGSGFKIAELQYKKMPIKERKLILVKGYENSFGKGLNIVKALELIDLEILKYQVVVFGAHNSVISYVKDKNLNFKVYSRTELKHNEVLDLMGKSLLYIGNSASDGLPNSLLEAVVMGAFPIQSNPGNATTEIIQDGINGLLINDVNDVEQLKEIILKPLNDLSLIREGFHINQILAENELDYAICNKKIIDLYDKVLK